MDTTKDNPRTRGHVLHIKILYGVIAAILLIAIFYLPYLVSVTARSGAKAVAPSLMAEGFRMGHAAALDGKAIPSDLDDRFELYIEQNTEDYSFGDFLNEMNRDD